jgi:uracil-DNA glycosylase
MLDLGFNTIKESWKNELSNEIVKDYFNNLVSALEDEYSKGIIYPKPEDVFSAFRVTDLNEVKVVILGQDPYHGENQAHGMAFSVQPGIKTPPSLKNIYKELNEELNLSIPNNGYLMKWAEQGVFLLNTVLTVRAKEAASHKGLGWEKFTDEVIRILGKQNRPMVFMLWGNPAQKKKKLLGDNPKHLILEAAHPSPLSAYRGFFGCNHLKTANEFLKKNNYAPIDWQIDDI